jgi:hypothetical protein
MAHLFGNSATNDVSFFSQSPAGYFDFDFTLPTLPPFDENGTFLDFMS